MTKQFYSTTEVAKALRLSRIEVFRKIKSGRLPAEKVGRNYIISHDALTEALGKSIGAAKQRDIEKAIDRAVKDYGQTLRRLGRE